MVEIEENSDSIEQVNAIKYNLKESYNFDDNEIQTVIDQCVWNLHQVMTKIQEHINTPKLKNLADRQMDILLTILYED